jgi:hypothetical protein
MSSAALDWSCVVAAMVDCGENRKRIAACRPGEGREGTWWPVSLAFDLQDIAFYGGKLHALTSRDGLVVFDDGELDLLRRESWRLHEPRPRPPAAKIVYRAWDLTARQYLVECNGRLLAAIRYVWQEVHRTVTVEVFALEPDYSSWVRVKEIVGHALFVGDACSGAYPAAAASTSDDLIAENHVYLVDDEMAISAELDKRNRHALIHTVEAASKRCDLYGSVLRRLRTVQTYIISGERSKVYRAGDSSARTGRWYPARVVYSLREGPDREYESFLQNFETQDFAF